MPTRCHSIGIRPQVLTQRRQTGLSHAFAGGTTSDCEDSPVCEHHFCRTNPSRLGSNDWLYVTSLIPSISFSPRRTVRLSRLFPLISLIFSVMAGSVLAQDKPDPRIYPTPQAQQETQNPSDDGNQAPQQNQPDYRNQTDQQNPPDYRNQPEQQNLPDDRNRPAPQDSPGYGTQPQAEVPPAPPVRRGPPQNWTPDAITYLGQNASSRTEFNLDHSMVTLASRMDQDDPDFRRVIAGVDGVSVHHFRFPGYGMYDPRILADVRQQYRAAGWQHISGSRSRDGGPGATDIWIRLDNTTIRNVAVLFAGPNQVNFVSVSCAISPIDLAHLGGHFGIPQIQGGVMLPRARNNPGQYPPQQPGY